MNLAVIFDLLSGFLFSEAAKMIMLSAPMIITVKLCKYLPFRLSTGILKDRTVRTTPQEWKDGKHEQIHI